MIGLCLVPLCGLFVTLARMRFCTPLAARQVLFFGKCAVRVMGAAWRPFGVKNQLDESHKFQLES